MRRIGLALVLAAVAAGCGAGGGGNNAQPSAGGDAPSQQATPGASGSELTSEWLVGRWQAGDGSGEAGTCAPGDTYFTLEPNGRYAFMEEQGRWTLEGDKLAIEVTQASSDSGVEAGQRSITTVRPLGANEAEFTREGSAPIRVTRCTN